MKARLAHAKHLYLVSSDVMYMVDQDMVTLNKQGMIDFPMIS